MLSCNLAELYCLPFFVVCQCLQFFAIECNCLQLLQLLQLFAIVCNCLQLLQLLPLFAIVCNCLQLFVIVAIVSIVCNCCNCCSCLQWFAIVAIVARVGCNFAVLSNPSVGRVHPSTQSQPNPLEVSHTIIGPRTTAFSFIVSFRTTAFSFKWRI